MDFGYTLAGLIVGFVVGLTGVGGGSLMTPLLVLLYGINPAVAVGTDLLYAAITKAGGSWVHSRRGSVNWKVVGLLAAGSVPASIATTLLLKVLAPDTRQLSGLITGTLGVALILTAMGIVFKENIRAYAKKRWGHRPAWSTRTVSLVTFGMGLILGVLVTVSSVGAGVVGTVMLFFLYPRMTTVQIIGTDIAHAVPLTAVAGLGHATLGTVDWTLLGSLLVGSLPGIYVGSNLAAKIPDRVLRPALAGMLVLIGGKLVF